MQKHPKTAIKIARGPGPAPMGKTFMGGAFTCFRGGPPAHEGSFPPREIRLKRLCVLWFLSCCCGIPPGAAWGRRWRGSPPAASASASPGRGRKSPIPRGGRWRSSATSSPARPLRRRPCRRAAPSSFPGRTPPPPGSPGARGWPPWTAASPSGRRHLPPAAGGPPGRRPHRAGGHPPGPPPGLGPLPPPLPGRGAAAGGRGRRPGAGAVLTLRDFRAPATKSAKNCL